MRVADYVIAELARAGAQHVFTVAGGGSVFLCHALAHTPGIRYVCTHHEQAAAMAAEGYARAGDRLGAVVVTSGPGGTNAITGVVGAWTDHVPMIVLSGQSFLKQTIAGRGVRTLGVQELNIVDVVRPITKYAVMVTTPRSIRYHMERALYEAQSGRPGPCWLDIPADIQNAQIEPYQLEGFTPQPEPGLTSALRESVARVLAGLRAAKRPLLHVGHGIRIARAQDMMRELVEMAGLPVVTARNGNDLIESDHPLYVGRPGTFAQRGANFAVQTCNFYLAIGTRLCLAQTGYNSQDYARNARIVQVDVDRAELDKGTLKLAQTVQADAGVFLAELLRQAEDGAGWPDWSEWSNRCAAWRRRYPAVLEEQRAQGKYLNSYALVHLLSDLCTKDDVIVTDVGFAYQCVNQAWRIKMGQRLISNGGTAAMGWGLPAAIGAAFATGRRVICIVGDGGLMMNVQELATLAHHGLPVKLVVLNNGGYLTMRQSQAHAFGEHMGSDEAGGLSFPDFSTLARANRLPYHVLRNSRDSHNLLPLAIDGTGPAFIEVMMDPMQEQIPKSINRRLPDGTIKQTTIEDAYPYLPAEELAENMRIDK